METFNVGRFYRLETISYFYRVEFIGKMQSSYRFSVLDETLMPIGQILEFTERELQSIKIRPATLSQTEA